MTATIEPLTDIDIHDLLRRRKSTRAFKPQTLDSVQVRRLFEAARWAASSSNEQPWRYIFATRDQTEDFAAIASTLNDGNRVWAQQAGLLIIAIAKRRKGTDGPENRHAFYDVGQSVAHLILQAVEDGLLARQMGGFSADKARESLHIPDGYDAITAIAVGYPGDPGGLPEAIQEKERAARTRKDLSEIVFQGTWDPASGF